MRYSYMLFYKMPYLIDEIFTAQESQMQAVRKNEKDIKIIDI